MTDWNLKFRPQQIVNVVADDGSTIRVRVEGVAMHKASDWQPVYYVREVDSGTAYTCCEEALRKEPKA